MHPRSLRLGSLSLFLLTTPALAFEQGAQTGPPLNQQYPGPNGLANFRKIVSGEFTGNLTRDAVVMDGNRPRLLVSPEYFDTSIGTPNDANDIAVLTGAMSGKDLLVTVEAGGLMLYERISATYLGNPTSSWNAIQLRDATSAWANAAFVCVGDVNGDGQQDIVGVMSNKRDLIVALGAGGTSFPTDQTFVNPSQTIHQLMLANWREDGDGEPNSLEFVIFSNLGWAVREFNGSWPKAVNWTMSPVKGTVIRDQNSTVDRIVTCAVLNGTDRLSISDVTRTEGPYNLGALGVVAMASGDFTTLQADGDLDLVLTTNTDRDLRIYENLSSTTSFNFATPAKHRFGPALRDPSLNLAGVTVGDFDSDGNQDILAPAQGHANPYPLGAYGSIALIRPNGAYGLFQCNPGAPAFIPSTGTGVPDKIRLRFDPPSPTGRLVPANGTSQTVELYVSVYFAPALGVEPNLDPYWVGSHIVPPQNGLAYLTFPLPSGYSLTTSTGIFSVVAYQRILENDVVVDRAPAVTAWVTPKPNMSVVNNAKDTIQWYGATRENEGIPVDGSIDIGPIIPPSEKDKEPKE